MGIVNPTGAKTSHQNVLLWPDIPASTLHLWARIAAFVISCCFTVRSPRWAMCPGCDRTARQAYRSRAAAPQKAQKQGASVDLAQRNEWTRPAILDHGCGSLSLPEHRALRATLVCPRCLADGRGYKRDDHLHRMPADTSGVSSDGQGPVGQWRVGRHSRPHAGVSSVPYGNGPSALCVRGPQHARDVHAFGTLIRDQPGPRPKRRDPHHFVHRGLASGTQRRVSACTSR